MVKSMAPCTDILAVPMRVLHRRASWTCGVSRSIARYLVHIAACILMKTMTLKRTKSDVALLYAIRLVEV